MLLVPCSIHIWKVLDQNKVYNLLVKLSNYIYINCKELKVQNFVCCVILQHSERNEEKKFFWRLFLSFKLQIGFWVCEKPFLNKVKESKIHSFTDFIRSCLSMPIVLTCFVIVFKSTWSSSMFDRVQPISYWICY